MILKLSLGEISRVDFELYHQLFTKKDNIHIVLMNTKTGMVCYDYLIRELHQ